MNKEEVIKKNKWRRAEENYQEPGVLMPYSPKEFGQAIDFAIDYLSKE